MLTARSLTKAFPSPDGPVVAVDGVDLDVAPGEVVGFLGPNGAGKSTTQRMLTTLLPLDGGEAAVAGCDVRTDPTGVRRRVGHVAQVGGGGTELPVRDELLFQGALHRLRGAELARRVDEVVERFGLGPFADRPGIALSGGQRRRFEVALGLVHRPPMLFLDEPTTGLDPQSRAALWDQVRRLRADGIAVLLTTHYLDEADALCDRLLVIDHGRIVAEGTPAGLKRGLGGDVVALGTGTRPGSGGSAGGAAGAGAGGAGGGLGRDAGAGLARVAEAVRGVPGVREAVVGGGGLRVTADPGAGAAALGALAAAGAPLDDVTLTRPTLDDVFLSLTGRSLRDGGPAGAGPDPDPDPDATGAPALAAR